MTETRRCADVASLNELRALAECEEPTADLYRFVGRITIHTPGGGQVVKPLGPENLLLRSSRLQNTGFVFGEWNCQRSGTVSMVALSAGCHCQHCGTDNKVALSARWHCQRGDTVSRVAL